MTYDLTDITTALDKLVGPYLTGDGNLETYGHPRRGRGMWPARAPTFAEWGLAFETAPEFVSTGQITFGYCFESDPDYYEEEGFHIDYEFVSPDLETFLEQAEQALKRIPKRDA